MPTPQEIQLKRMCSKSETLVRAQVILHTATTRTRPGSGHELGKNTIGLPAICAFIASSELQNDDVSEKVAQTVSCLAPKIFSSTLATIRAALAEGASSPSVVPQKARRSSRHRPATDYPSLVREHQVKLAKTVVGWLEDAERALDSSTSFRAVPGAEGAPVKCATFFWVCQVLELTRVSRELMLDRYNVQDETFDELVDLLNEACISLRNRILKEIDDLREASRRKGKAKSDEKSSLSKVSMISTPRKARARAAELESASFLVTPSSQMTPKKPSLKRANDDSSTPQLDTPRRRVAFSAATESETDDSAMEVDDVLPSPTKRRRVASTTSEATDDTIPASTARTVKTDDLPETPSRRTSLRQHIHAEPTVTPSKTPKSALRRAPKAAAQRASPAPEVSDEEKGSGTESDGALPPPRRHRPAFADRAQWTSRDPRLDREWAAVRRAAKRAEEAWGHPFERFRPQQGVNVSLAHVP